jgi:hypothetical protein
MALVVGSRGWTPLVSGSRGEMIWRSNSMAPFGHVDVEQFYDLLKTAEIIVLTSSRVSGLQFETRD